MQESNYNRSPESLSSSLTTDSFNRRPRFQRKSLLLKSQGKSYSSKYSGDQMSLEKLYVKNAFLKTNYGLFYQQRQQDGDYVNIFDNIVIDGYSKINVLDTVIDHQNHYQPLHATSQFTNFKQEGFLSNNNNHEENIKEQIDKSLKETIFYKEKCLKHELRIKQMLKQQQKLLIDLESLRSENKNLKLQIQTLKKQSQSEYYTQKKPRRSFNKNLAKLKQQYMNFKDQQDWPNALFEQKLAKMNKKVEEVNAQNEKLRENLAQQNQLYNEKIKIMQEKQDFLQKTLSFTKNSLVQFQKNYNEKQIEIFDSKRLNEIINEKNVQIQKLQSKYNNLLKIINGDKKRTQNLKITKNKQQRLYIPPNGQKSKTSVGTKKILFHQKQINLQHNMKGKEKIQNKEKQESNLLIIKLLNPQAITKQNYRMAEVKNTRNLSSQQVSQQERFLKRDSSDLTISSFNSFEFSPQK